MDNLDGLKSAMIVEETVRGHTECLPVVFARRVATEDRLLVTITVSKAMSLSITSKSDSLQ